MEVALPVPSTPPPSLPGGRLFYESTTPPYEEDLKNGLNKLTNGTSQEVLLPQYCAPVLQHSRRIQAITIQDDIMLAPYLYIKSLPGKGIRDILIDALNIWLQVPEKDLVIIKKVVELLHTSSLMFDDIEDGSDLRRGKPTAHRIFGIGQTMNSSTYVLMSSIAKAQELSSRECVSIVTEEVSNMLLGQSIDLHSTYLAKCPTEAEYLSMVDHKTGALFRLAYRLMKAQSNAPVLPDLESILVLLGRYFQIRDDYMNLASREYTDQKGFCEDLDEGKYSFPIVHFFHAAPCTSRSGTIPLIELQNIFMTRNRSGLAELPISMKLYALELLESAGSLKYTVEILEQLDRDLGMEILMVENSTGLKNPVLGSLVKKLKVS